MSSVDRKLVDEWIRELKSFGKTEEERMSIHNKYKTLAVQQLADNRFYVGSHLAIQGWGYPTVEQAIEHAKQLMELNGSEQFVVEIIKIVQRKPQPIIVKELTRNRASKQTSRKKSARLLKKGRGV